MVIKLLKQNLEYFRHSNNIIKAEELDNRVNDIVNYLNDEIIFKLNNLNDNIIIGSLSQKDINSILKSNLDNSYYWKKVDNDDFLDNSIDIKKINYKNISNSVFKSSLSGDIELIKNQDIENNIILCDNSGIKFDRISTNFIDPLTKITGVKIQYYSISDYNLSNIIPNIIDNSIIGSNFKKEVITTDKITNNSISLNSFSNNTKDLLSNYIWDLIIPNNFVNLNSTGNRNNITTIWDRYFLQTYVLNDQYHIPFNKFNKFYVKNIIQYYCNVAKITDLSLTDPSGKKVGAEKRYILSPNNFKPNSINPNRLICWFHRQNNDKCHNINNILAPNSISINKLTQAIVAKLG